MRANKSSTCASTNEEVEVIALDVDAVADSIEATGLGVSAGEVVEEAGLEVGGAADPVEKRGVGVATPHAESSGVRATNNIKDIVFIIGNLYLRLCQIVADCLNFFSRKHFWHKFRDLLKRHFSGHLDHRAIQHVAE
ncbi:MAG TPA: hypothetical protein VJM08_11365, partial [Anaerolineales bacterium]|nr:hypothetical protein [Anaerolineales bacterium]